MALQWPSCRVTGVQHKNLFRCSSAGINKKGARLLIILQAEMKAPRRNRHMLAEPEAMLNDNACFTSLFQHPILHASLRNSACCCSDSVFATAEFPHLACEVLHWFWSADVRETGEKRKVRGHWARTSPEVPRRSPDTARLHTEMAVGLLSGPQLGTENHGRGSLFPRLPAKWRVSWWFPFTRTQKRVPSKKDTLA